MQVFAWSIYKYGDQADGHPKLDRMLWSVMPYLDGLIFCDTGSPPWVREKLREWQDMFPEKPIIWAPVETVWWMTADEHPTGRPCIDFAATRNAALDRAREQLTPDDWLVIVDSDEELLGGASVKHNVHRAAQDGHVKLLLRVYCQTTGVLTVPTLCTRAHKLDDSARWEYPVHNHLTIEGSAIGNAKEGAIKAHYTQTQSLDRALPALHKLADQGSAKEKLHAHAYLAKISLGNDDMAAFERHTLAMKHSEAADAFSAPMWLGKVVLDPDNQTVMDDATEVLGDDHPDLRFIAMVQAFKAWDEACDPEGEFYINHLTQSNSTVGLHAAHAQHLRTIFTKLWTGRQLLTPVESA